MIDCNIHSTMHSNKNDRVEIYSKISQIVNSKYMDEEKKPIYGQGLEGVYDVELTSNANITVEFHVQQNDKIYTIKTDNRHLRNWIVRHKGMGLEEYDYGDDPELSFEGLFDGMGPIPFTFEDGVLYWSPDTKLFIQEIRLSPGQCIKPISPISHPIRRILLREFEPGHNIIFIEDNSKTQYIIQPINIQVTEDTPKANYCITGLFQVLIYEHQMQYNGSIEQFEWEHMDCQGHWKDSECDGCVWVKLKAWIPELKYTEELNLLGCCFKN